VSSLPFVDRMDIFDSTLISHSRLDLVRRRVNFLKSTTERTRKRNIERDQEGGYHHSKPDELHLLPIVGPSGSTKSRTMQIITEELHLSRADPAHIPALVVTLRDTTSTTKRLHLAILEAFGDAGSKALYSKNYTEDNASNSIRGIAAIKNTSILVLDEAHNVLTNTSPSKAAHALKSLLNDGLFSLVVCGTDAVRPLFAPSQEFGSRLLAAIDFTPPAAADVEGCNEMFEYAQRLCDEIYSAGVIDRPFSIVDTIEHCAILYDMTGGTLGQVSRHLRRGIDLAFDRGMPFINWQTLIEAFDSWYRFTGATSPHPIRNGVKNSTLTAVQKLVAKYERP